MSKISLSFLCRPRPDRRSVQQRTIDRYYPLTILDTKEIAYLLCKNRKIDAEYRLHIDSPHLTKSNATLIPLTDTPKN